MERLGSHNISRSLSGRIWIGVQSHGLRSDYIAKKYLLITESMNPLNQFLSKVSKEVQLRI